MILRNFSTSENKRRNPTTTATFEDATTTSSYLKSLSLRLNRPPSVSQGDNEGGELLPELSGSLLDVSGGLSAQVGALGSQRRSLILAPPQVFIQTLQ